MYEANEKGGTSLPEPKGYRILVKMPKVAEKTEGGIFRPDSLIHTEQVAAAVAYVMKVGGDAYQDEKRFPDGAWCKAGDWVIINPYTGTRFKVDGSEYRLINDDSVQGTVDNPASIERA